MLLVGLGYQYVQRGIKVIDDRIAIVVGRIKRWRPFARRQET